MTTALRPAFVIRTHATSILREPATTPSTVALASSVFTSLDHLLDREAVRQHDRLGAAVVEGGEQFERAAAVGLGAAAEARHWRGDWLLAFLGYHASSPPRAPGPPGWTSPRPPRTGRLVVD